MAKFNTIISGVASELKDRGSRFIGLAHRVSSKDEAERIVKDQWLLHPKARHVCYAYLLRSESDYRANDDGEPSGSAGLPIFNQIKSAELKYTLVTVVRYFGGTKLGVSGLIAAYKQAAKETILTSETGEEEETILVMINFGYPEMETVMSFIKSKGADVVEQDFREKCILTIRIALDELDDYENYFSSYKIPLEY